MYQEIILNATRNDVAASSTMDSQFHPPLMLPLLASPQGYGLAISILRTQVQHILESVAFLQECSGKELWDFCGVGRSLLLVPCRFHDAFILHRVGNEHTDLDFSEERQTNSLTGFEYVIVGKWRYNIPSLAFSYGLVPQALARAAALWLQDLQSPATRCS
jgi:hypothetical protein